MFFHARRDEAAGASLPVRALVVDPGFAQDPAPAAALEFLAAVAVFRAGAVLRFW
jgi:hypothetical protein